MWGSYGSKKRGEVTLPGCHFLVDRSYFTKSGHEKHGCSSVPVQPRVLLALPMHEAPGEHFQIVPGWIEEVEATPAMLGVGLVRALPLRIRPVRQPSMAHALQHSIEGRLVQQKGVMLRRKGERWLREVEHDAVCEHDGQEVPIDLRLTQIEHVCIERGRSVFVGSGDDQVVETNGPRRQKRRSCLGGNARSAR